MHRKLLRELMWLIAAACGGLSLLSCGRDVAPRGTSAEVVPYACSPLGFGGGVAWATSCDGETVIDTSTGDNVELHCELPNDQAEVQDIFAVGSNAAVVFSCIGDSDDTTTMIQSLVDLSLPPVDMNFPAFDIKAAVYSDAGDGYVLMLAGKCHGLLAYKLDSPVTLEGEMRPVSMISIGDQDFELDGGQGYDAAPACTDLSAVRGLGAPADGSSVALGLVGPANQSIFERQIELFVGVIMVESDRNAVRINATMRPMAGDLDDLAYPLGVTTCDGEPALVISGGGELSVVTDSSLRRLSLDVDREWAGFALGEGEGVLLVETEVDFDAGDVYRVDNPSIC